MAGSELALVHDRPPQVDRVSSSSVRVVATPAPAKPAPTEPAVLRAGAWDFIPERAPLPRWIRLGALGLGIAALGGFMLVASRPSAGPDVPAASGFAAPVRDLAEGSAALAAHRPSDRDPLTEALASVAPPQLPAAVPETPAPRQPPPPPRPLTRSERREQAALAASAAEGHLQAAGSTYVAHVDPEGTFWGAAADSCREIEVDGLGGFRLPTVAELRKLKRAGVLGSGGVWWSSQKTPRDRDARLAFDVARRRSVVWLAQEPGGSTVCVRPRR